jgi:hypothetical protein
MSEKGELQVDRSGWVRGPWDGEPDRVEWKTGAGLPGLIVRQQSSGHLCGYVAVTNEHPLYGKGYSDPYPIGVHSIEVHGGITYAEKCQGHVCHVPAPGEPDDVWWLGFDAHHYGDASPRYESDPRYGNDPGSTYKTVGYMRAEVERLASQLADAGLAERLDAAAAEYAAENEGASEAVA